MKKVVTLIRKGVNTVVERLRTQGMWINLVWLYGRGIPKITGNPLIKYSQLTPQVYVGSQYGQAGKRKLERLGINGDVNMRLEFDDAAHGLALAHYCHLPTVDDDPPTLEHLKQGAEFMHQVMAEGGTVYIHCAGGIGRAPTMGAAYFISQGLSLEQAIALIKKSRPFIRIMPAQMTQLQRFEAVQKRSG